MISYYFQNESGGTRRYEDSDTDLIIDENELSYGEQNNVSDTERGKVTARAPQVSTILHYDTHNIHSYISCTHSFQLITNS